MKKKILSVLKYVFFFGLGFFLIWWQFSKMTGVQKEQFEDSLAHANYWILIPVIVMAMLSHLSRAVRWKILIEPLGFNPSTAITFYTIMSGYLANTFIPRGGELLKCSLLSRYEKIPVNKLIGTILIERAFDLVCYFIFIGITVLVQIKYVSHFVKEKLELIASNKNGLAVWTKLLILIIIIFIIVLFFRWIFKKYAHHSYIISIKGFHIGLMEGIRTIKYLKNRGWFIAHTIFIWSMYLLQIYAGFFALSATSNLGITQACSVLSLATLAMIVSPGGIGAFPIAVQEVLLIYNVDNVSFGWMIWGVSTGIVIVAGLLSLLILTLKKKKINEAEQTNTA